MELKIKIVDVLSWIAHSAGMVLIILFIGKLSGSYASGYGFGLSVFFLKEALENKTVEIWKWKTLDSILDFVFPMVFGAAMLRYLGVMYELS